MLRAFCGAAQFASYTLQFAEGWGQV